MLKFKIALIYLLLFLPIVFAQTPSMEMNVIGYGRTSQEVYISFQNTGDIQLTDVTISIDGEEHEKIDVSFSPGKSFVDVLFLEPGEYLIEARTPEGAYDSLSLNVVKGELPPEDQGNATLPGLIEFTAENVPIIVSIVAIVFLVILCVFIIKRREK